VRFHAGGTFFAPVGEHRGVKTLAAQKRADGSGSGGRGGFGEDLELVLRGEAAALGERSYFGVRWGLGAGLGGRSTATKAKVAPLICCLFMRVLFPALHSN